MLCVGCDRRPRFLAESSLRGTATPATLTDCGSKEVSFSSLTITPSQLVKGRPAFLQANGTMTAPVSAGSFALNVKLNGIGIFTHNGNICGASNIPLPLGLGNINLVSLACPAASGADTSVDVTVTLPTIAPSGSYTITLQGTDSTTNAVAYCLDAQFSL